MNSDILNQRFKIDPSRITGQFTTIEPIDLQRSVEDQIEAVRKHYESVNDDSTIKDLPVIDCYAFFTALPHENLPLSPSPTLSTLPMSLAFVPGLMRSRLFGSEGNQTRAEGRFS